LFPSESVICRRTVMTSLMSMEALEVRWRQGRSPAEAEDSSPNDG